MKKYSAMLLLLASLVGCATSKPPMPDKVYTEMVGYTYGIQECGLSDRMELATVASGRSMLANNAGTYTIDRDRMNSEYLTFAAQKPKVTDDWCKGATIRILQYKQENETKQRSATTAPSSAPSFTNCSTYFGYTHCTHY